MSATKFNSTSDPRRDIGFYNGAWRTPEGLALTTVEPNWDVNLPLGEKLINKLHGAMSFERGSIATTVNKSGIVEDVGIDEPAITKDGMSCYQSVENICIQSVDLSATGWLLGNGLARTQDSTLAPDQTSLAWILDKNGNTTANLLRRIDITDTGQSLVFSFYAKSKGSNVVRATLGLVPFLPVTLIDAEFDLDSGNWTKTDPAIHSTKTIKLIDDWWFISVHTNLTNLNNTQVSLYLSPAEASTSDMYFWRPQLAETDIHILPIETGSTSATRAADVASIPMSGNMPPAGEPFTIVIDCAIPDDGVARYVLDAGTPDTTNSLTFRRNSDGDVRFNIGPNSVTVSGIDDKTHRFIYTLDDPEEKLAVDGEISTNNVITALSYPLDKPLYIGGNRGVSGFLNSEVRNFHIIHRALSDAEIYALGGPDGVLIGDIL